MAIEYVSSANHILSAHPPIQLDVLAQGWKKKCIKGPPIAKILSSSANLAN